ncbi:MAG: hypothetical protein ACYCVB_15250 [Bacilli bacterium]
MKLYSNVFLSSILCTVIASGWLSVEATAKSPSIVNQPSVMTGTETKSDHNIMIYNHPFANEYKRNTVLDYWNGTVDWVHLNRFSVALTPLLLEAVAVANESTANFLPAPLNKLAFTESTKILIGKGQWKFYQAQFKGKAIRYTLMQLKNVKGVTVAEVSLTGVKIPLKIYLYQPAHFPTWVIYRIDESV